MIKRIVPKKFLWRYPLRTGAVIGIIIFSVVSTICTIAMIVQVLLMNSCNNCSLYVWRNAYSFSITGVIYCVIMLAMHAWAFWGIREKKGSVLLSWAVLTTVWLAQTFFLLVILICIHVSNINFVSWIICFLLGLVSICILGYFILIVFGLSLEMKENQDRNIDENT